MKWYQTLRESLLYAGIESHDKRIRATFHVISAYSWLGFVAFGLFGLSHTLTAQMITQGNIEIGGALAMLINAVGLRFTHNARLAKDCFLLTMLAILMAMLLTGGVLDTGIFWFIIFPVGAYFLTTKYEGTAWVALVIGMSLMMMGLSSIGVVDIAYRTETMWQMLLAIVVVSLALYAYQQSREDLQTRTILTEQSLKEEKIKAEAIIENIGDTVIATDEDGSIVFVNNVGHDMFGFTKSEMIGKRFVDLVPMLDKNGKRITPEHRPLMAVVKHATPVRTEATYRRKDGSTFRAVSFGTPVVVGGKQIGSIGLIRDITEEEAVDRAKTEFITLASHQLRTPLSAITWISELLSGGDVGKLTAQQRKYIDQIHQSGRRMAAIIEDLLLVSSLEVGGFMSTPEELDLRQLVQTVIRKQRSLLLEHEKKIHISEEYDPGIRNVRVDPTAANAILQSLIGNAFKYTPDGGRVTILISCSDEKANAVCSGSVYIKVTDTGYGIPRNEQKKLFTKLFRASNVVTRDTDGTGLGLFIVKAILDRIGGQIRFESQEGKGSTFTVLLPLDELPKRRPEE